jgi:hypothetical protein
MTRVGNQSTPQPTHGKSKIKLPSTAVPWIDWVASPKPIQDERGHEQHEQPRGKQR